MKAKSVEDVLGIIVRHMAYHSDFFVEAMTDGNVEDQVSHGSALAALKMLKMEIEGEQKW